MEESSFCVTQEEMPIIVVLLSFMLLDSTCHTGTPRRKKPITFTVESVLERVSKYLHVYPAAPKINRIIHNKGNYGALSHL